jgi:hypothetical protein
VTPRIAGLLFALVVLVGGGLLVGRGVATTTVADATEAEITVECTGWSGAGDGCAAWGEEVWADGPPSSTFDAADVVRLRFDRSALGFGDCSVDWFVSRYPDDPAWTASVPCPQG